VMKQSTFFLDAGRSGGPLRVRALGHHAERNEGRLVRNVVKGQAGFLFSAAFASPGRWVEIPRGKGVCRDARPF
jgi:hypothetical protein